MSVITQEKKLFSFEELSYTLHCQCKPEICAKKGGNLCINEALSDYLKEQKRVQNRYPLLKGDDWNHLISEREEALKYLTSTQGYRLRFLSHAEAGKAFVRNLLNGNSRLWEDNLFKGLWGSPLVLSQIRARFEDLGDQAEAHSVGAIYRLYDLLEGRNIEKIKFDEFEFLALLFSMGHGDQSSLGGYYGDVKRKAESICHLVAGYQFFRAFSQEKLKCILGMYQKARGAPEDAKITAINYLKSPKGFEDVLKTWKLFQKAYYDFFRNQEVSITAKNDDQFAKKLRETLPPEPINKKFRLNLDSRNT